MSLLYLTAFIVTTRNNPTKPRHAEYLVIALDGVVRRVAIGNNHVFTVVVYDLRPTLLSIRAHQHLPLEGSTLCYETAKMPGLFDIVRTKLTTKRDKKAEVRKEKQELRDRERLQPDGLLRLALRRQNSVNSLTARDPGVFHCDKKR
nr:hypothetical protein CFP56_21896 [Quercus suber]